jgi:transposase
MKAGPDRRYTPEFRDAAVKQVIEGGRTVATVARSLEMSGKSLANWVYRARKGQELVKRAPAQPVSEMEAELSSLRHENLKLTRFRGHPILMEEGVRYAYTEASVPGGVPPTDGRAGPGRPHAVTARA